MYLKTDSGIYQGPPESGSRLPVGDIVHGIKTKLHLIRRQLM